MTRDEAFETFWKSYPRKVGKLAAKKAFSKALNSGTVTLHELLAGIEAYVKHKPGYADFAHPSSWLSAGRWMDEWDAPPKPMFAAELDWFSECTRLHGRRCNGQHGHAVQMAIDAQKAEP